MTFTSGAMRFLFLILLFGCAVTSQSSRIMAAEALLIPEVISREVGLQVGGLQTPDIQFIETREVAVFVGIEPDPPYRQTESREVAMVVSDAQPPPRLEDLNVAVSPTGHTVTLDWSKYDQYSVRDVTHYQVFMAESPFVNVQGMVPFLLVGGETFTWTITGLSEWTDRYFAVVPVDGLGNRITEVVYSGAYVLQTEVIARELAFFNGMEPFPPYQQVESREVDLVISDPQAPPALANFEVSPSPTGHTVTLDWSAYDPYPVRDIVHFDIYRSDRPITSLAGVEKTKVGMGTHTWTFTGLPEWKDHYFAIIPVDGQGHFNEGFVWSAAYILQPEVITREAGLFIGIEPDPPYRMVETREVGLVVADQTVPAPVTSITSDFSVNISNIFYGLVNLDWTGYDLWSQRDVVRYRIFYRDSFFSDIREPGVVEVPGGLQNGNEMVSVSAAFEKKVYYFAVVAEDQGGNFNPIVYSRSTKEPMPEFLEFALNAGRPFADGILPIDGEWTPLFGTYDYTRTKAAIQGGMKFYVEWSDNLVIWHRTGVTEQVVADDGVIETVRAFVPRGDEIRRFTRLYVVPSALPE